MRAGSTRRTGEAGAGWVRRAQVLLSVALLAAGCQPSSTPHARLAETRAKDPDGEPAKASPPASESPEFVVSVLALNDLHGRLGALPAFAGYVDALRKARGASGAVIVVDAGDMFQGTLGSNLSEGASVISAYNALGVAAAAIGNHEFDYGAVNGATSGEAALPQGALRARIAEARFPLLAANLQASDGGQFPAWKNLARDALLQVGPVRLGVVGGLTEETPAIVMPDYFAGLTVAPLATAVRGSAEALRQRGANAVLAVVHAGGDCKAVDDAHDLASCDVDSGEVFALARSLPAGLLDGIVAGHTHAKIAHFLNGVAIVEGTSRGKAFSRLDLRFERASRRLLSVEPFPPEPLCLDSAELADCATHPYRGLTVNPDRAMAELIEPALAKARQAREQLLGVELLAEFPADHQRESALGNLFADAMRALSPGSDFALTNGGGLRAKLPAGRLTYGALFEAMPFDNRLVKLELSAAELTSVLSAHLSSDARGIVSISGLAVTARCSAGKLVVTLRRPDGRVVANTARLSVATSDYLATGGDRLFSPLNLARSRIQPVGDALLRDALSTELSRRQRLDPNDPKLLDRAHPRISMPGARPIACSNP